MTTKADYTAEEWELLRKAPLIMAAAVIVSDLSGSIGVAREFLSMAQAVEETGQRPDPNELVAALVADLQAPQGEHAEETEDITDISEARTKALAESREIATLLARRSAPAEAEGFKRWMLSIARRVSEAAREGGVLGIGSKLVSEKETTMIGELAAALGMDAAQPD
jgi:hypothetical protein